jgi:cysteinyl-tRNA synthetase
VMELADARFAARVAREFDEADRLRAELEALGWEMQDMPDGGYRLVAKL